MSEDSVEVDSAQDGDRPQVVLKSRPPDLILRGASQGPNRKNAENGETPSPPATQGRVTMSRSTRSDSTVKSGARRGFKKLVDDFEEQCTRYFSERDFRVRQEFLRLRSRNNWLVAEIRRLSGLLGESSPELPEEDLNIRTSAVSEFQYQSQYGSEFSNTKPRNTSGESYDVMLRKARDVMQGWAKRVADKKQLATVASTPSRNPKRTSDCSSTVSHTNSSQEKSSMEKRIEQEDYDLLPFWTQLGKQQEEEAERGPQLKSQWTLTGLDVGRRGSLPQALNFAQTKSFGGRSRFSMNPLSKPHVVWQSIGVALIMFDLVTIPLQVFEPEWRDFFVVSLWVTNIYWSLDVVFSFFVAFHKNGELVFGYYDIAKHYITTWFIPDIGLVTCDMVLLMYEITGAQDMENIGYVKVGRTLRILRFARLVRLIKLRRFFDFFDSLMAQISSEYLLTAARITKLIIFILMCTHLLACAWYGLGLIVVQENQGSSWLDKSFKDHHDVGYRYSTSLHWSLTQFTPASMEVVPTNAFERAFNICVVIFALVLFSSFVSSITEAMAYLRHVNSRRNEQFGQVRKFFAENHVSMTITSRVWRYLEQSARLKRTQMLWKDVIVFKELPDSLQKELRQEVYLPTILCHPFFQAYGRVNGASLRALCHQAISETALAPGQDLFGFGELAAHMYFVVAGTLEYFQPSVGMNNDSSVFSGLVEVHSWACEAAYWIRWFHAGWMVGQRGATVLVNLDVDRSHELMKQYSEALRECLKYARLFATSSMDNLEKLSDLPNEFDAAQSIADQAFTDEANMDRRSSGRSSLVSDPIGHNGMWGLLGGVLSLGGVARSSVRRSVSGEEVDGQQSIGARSDGTRRSSFSTLFNHTGHQGSVSSAASSLMRGAGNLFMSKSFSEHSSRRHSADSWSARGSSNRHSAESFGVGNSSTRRHSAEADFSNAQ